jgi:hypothetical protein
MFRLGASWQHVGKWGAFVSTPRPGIHRRPYRNAPSGHCVPVSHANDAIGDHRVDGELCWCAPSWLEEAGRPVVVHRPLFSHEIH